MSDAVELGQGNPGCAGSEHVAVDDVRAV
ncbi:hypothetical protein A2U01_0102033, partial [Trifolium medium]|nr:hypothetical protein [Trifolium medium]